MDPLVLQKARRQLARHDGVMKKLIRAVGPCTLQNDPHYFAVLVRSIISQQISTKAALAISARVLKTVRRFQPKNILEATDTALRESGLSQGKLLALRDLAEKCRSGIVPLKKLPDMDNEAIIESLVQVRGIGRWTAEMFLIFSLGRLDVLPVDDYGLRNGMKIRYGLPEMPRKDVMTALAEPWQPYRSIGTWYIWKSFAVMPS